MASDALGSILPSLLGLGAQIGTAIPGLRKRGPQHAFLKRQQAGGGVGSQVANRAASLGARSALAAVGSGASPSRGLALREGLRSAERIISEGATTAGQIAAAEAQAATEALRQNAIRRQQNLEQLGSQIAGFGSTLGASLSSMKQANEGTTGALQEVPSFVLPAPAPLTTSGGPHTQYTGGLRIPLYGGPRLLQDYFKLQGF